MQGVLGQPLAAGRRQALEELGLAAALQQVRTTLNSILGLKGAALQQTHNARCTCYLDSACTCAAGWSHSKMMHTRAAI